MIDQHYGRVHQTVGATINFKCTIQDRVTAPMQIGKELIPNNDIN